MAGVATRACGLAAKLYRSLSADVSESTFDRLHDGVLELVQDARSDARALAERHILSELSECIGKTNAGKVELKTSPAPKATDVGPYVDNAVATARTMVDAATQSGADASEAFQRADYHAQAIIRSEATVAYQHAREALAESLASMPAEDAEALGFQVASSDADLRAFVDVQTRADGDATKWIPIIGERWDARADACSRCASAHAEVRPIGFSFSQPGPTVHTSCQCVRTLWAVMVPWDSEDRAHAMSREHTSAAATNSTAAQTATDPNPMQAATDDGIARFTVAIASRAAGDGEGEPADGEDSGPRVIRDCVISSESIDSHCSILRAAGCDLSRYEQNPLLCWNHPLSSWTKEAEPEDILGHCVVRKGKNKQTLADLYFDPEDVNPKAERVYRQCVNKTIRMLSVGMRPLKWHYESQGEGQRDLLIIDEWMLLEISVTPIGSNPDAMMPRATDLRSRCPPLPPAQPAPAAPPPPPVETDRTATNTSEPSAVPAQVPACASTHNKESLMDKAILEVLGCKADAPETEVLATATRMRDQVAAFIALSGADSFDASVGIFRGWQASTAKVAELDKQIADIRAAELTRERTELIAKGVSDLKITPAEVDGWVKDAAIETLRSFVATAPARAAAAPTPQPAPASGVELTDEDRKMIAASGMTEAAYIAAKRELDGKAGA